MLGIYRYTPARRSSVGVMPNHRLTDRFVADCSSRFRKDTCEAAEYAVTELRDPATIPGYQRVIEERTRMALDISRIGEPRPLGISAGRAVCEITTTCLPPGRRGDRWHKIFGFQLTGSLLAQHDGAETITVTCDPREYPNWLLLVDLAILRTNEKEEAVAVG